MEAPLTDPTLGSTGHYLKAPCTKPCGAATCLPCPQGTFLARENHYETRCARCQACDELGEGLPSAGGGGVLEDTSGQGLSEGSGWLKPSLWVGGPCAHPLSPHRTPPHPMPPHAMPCWCLHPGPASGCLCALPSCDLPVPVPQPLVCDDPHTSLTLGAVLSLVSASPFSRGPVPLLCGGLWF